MKMAFGPMLSMDWSTQAKREANIEKLRVKDAADPMMIEQFLLQVEDDSKVRLVRPTSEVLVAAQANAQYSETTRFSVRPCVR